MKIFLLKHLRTASLVLFISVSFHAYAQHDRDETPRYDYTYTYSKVPVPYVSFTNGTLPFRSGDLWGFADKNNHIVMEPQFDRLVYGGENYCIAYSSDGPKLIHQDMRIVADFKSFTGEKTIADGTAGLKVLYLIYEKGYEITDEKGTVNYARLFLKDRPGLHIYRDMATFLQAVERYTDPGPGASYTVKCQGDTGIDSIGVYLHKDSSAVRAVRRSGGSFTVHGLPPHIHTWDRFVSWDEDYYEGDKMNARSYMIDLLTMDTVLVHDFYYHISSPDGRYHVYLPYKGGQHEYSLLDSRGKRLFSSPNMFTGFTGGYLLERYGEYPQSDRTRLIRLHDLSVFKEEVKELSTTENARFLLTVDDKRRLKIYIANNEQPIFERRVKKKKSFYRYFHIVEGKDMDMLVTGRKKRQEVYSSAGKLVSRAKAYHDVNFLPDANTFVLATEDGLHQGIYLPASDSIHWLKKGSSAWPFAPDKMLLSTNDSTRFLTDFREKPLLDGAFYSASTQRAFIGIEKVEDAPMEYYDMELRPIPSVAFMENLQYERSPALSRHAGTVIAFSNRTDPKLYGIMSGDFRVVIPPKYKSILLHPNGRYYIVTTIEGKSGYVRLDGTELWK